MAVSGIGFYLSFGIGNHTDNSNSPAPYKEAPKKQTEEYVDTYARPFDYSYGTSPSVIYGDKWRGNMLASDNAVKYPGFEHDPIAKK